MDALQEATEAMMDGVFENCETRAGAWQMCQAKYSIVARRYRDGWLILFGFGHG